MGKYLKLSWLHVLLMTVVFMCICSMNVEVSGQEVVGDDTGTGVAPQAAATTEMVPALFVFGDSLIDNGNNNNLASLAKANYYPYGIDFKAGPTGRFSNGYTMVDEIGMY